MALTIGTNNAAINSAASASSVNRDIEISMARLSSGKRINSASDDAAGVAISSRLTAEIRGTNQAIRNALDAQALIDTAEGAYKQLEEIFQRTRENFVQQANDTNSLQDRLNIYRETGQLGFQIEQIFSSTTWAGTEIMTGSVFSFQVGAHIDDKNQILVQPKTYTEIVDTTGLDMDGYVNDLTEIVNRGLNVLDTNRLYTGLIMLADRYIENTNLARSELGAISNRLNHVVNNLTNISINLSAAKGGIEDADFALETTQLAKNQILQQASTAMLAQANASKQNVLSLLQG